MISNCTESLANPRYKMASYRGLHTAALGTKFLPRGQDAPSVKFGYFFLNLASIFFVCASYHAYLLMSGFEIFS